jgi:hypothetical protein
MRKVSQLWVQYATPSNLKVLYVVFTLIALAIAGGAPSIGSGNPAT